MRRSFLRTPGSPQASVTVETPAHYALTLLLLIGSFSEVVIGSVEPTMSYASIETQLQNYCFYFNSQGKLEENTKKYVWKAILLSYEEEIVTFSDGIVIWNR